MTYSIGDPQNPVESDKHYEDYDEAEEEAKQASIDDSIWCVWNDDDGAIECIVYQGIVYC